MRLVGSTVLVGLPQSVLDALKPIALQPKHDKKDKRYGARFGPYRNGERTWRRGQS